MNSLYEGKNILGYLLHGDMEREVEELILAAFHECPSDHQIILSEVFRLQPNEQILKVIGTVVGISRERVRQILEKAINDLAPTTPARYDKSEVSSFEIQAKYRGRL